jgi:hypothetical protein
VGDLIEARPRPAFGGTEVARLPFGPPALHARIGERELELRWPCSTETTLLEGILFNPIEEAEAVQGSIAPLHLLMLDVEMATLRAPWRGAGASRLMRQLELSFS